MENNKCYAYMRVSTSDQENSLEIQEKNIKAYCSLRGLEIVDTFVDENISGGTEIFKRPYGCNLKNLNNIKNIVAIKPDRLFRSVSDALITTDIWNKQNVSLHIVDAGGVSLSTKTAIGRLLFTTIISFAEFERNLTGERTKAVLNNKKSTGKVYARSVMGYDKVDGMLVKNEVEQLTVKEILGLKGRYSFARIARIMNHTGFRTKTNKRFLPSTVQMIIKNQIHKTI